VASVSLVVFPFKDEDPATVGANLRTAAAHERITEVWAVAAPDSAHTAQVTAFADDIAARSGKHVRILPQQRLGRFRPGKGDAMNTAIAAAESEGWDRAHFFDADITNFDHSWIDGAEDAADRGYGVVRHRFPRAATDAMITWLVTRPSMALLFPGTFLPRLDQPLGGELLLTRPALERLAGSDLVRARSDWGIDTVITYATSVMGLGLYEHHVADGKRHSLYGSLEELRPMLIECLAAAISLRGLPGPGGGDWHGSDQPQPIPPDLLTTVAYDYDRTLDLLAAPLAPEEHDLVAGTSDPGRIMLMIDPSRPRPELMDAPTWLDTLRFLYREFELGVPAWETLAFRLWLHRVIAYTREWVPKGYEAAIGHLEGTIRDIEALADHH
jgi:mannosylglycerate synthase